MSNMLAVEIVRGLTTLLEWIASNYLWISLIAAILAIAIKCEKKLPKRLHKSLVIIGLFIAVLTPTLALLKKGLDDKWKAEMQKQVAALQPKPLKERVKDCLNSIDPRILPALARGQTQFHGLIPSSKFSQLMTLCAEPGASELIAVRSDLLMMNVAGTSEPTSTGASIQLDPSLLK